MYMSCSGCFGAYTTEYNMEYSMHIMGYHQATSVKAMTAKHPMQKEID
jgi:hypothetical protein